MDKDKVLPLVAFGYDYGPLWRDVQKLSEKQRDADLAVLEKVAEAVRRIDRPRSYVCTSCGGAGSHDYDCAWLTLERLGIVESV